MVAEGVGGAAELRAWLQAAEARKVAGKGFFEAADKTPESAAQERGGASKELSPAQRIEKGIQSDSFATRLEHVGRMGEVALEISTTAEDAASTFIPLCQQLARDPEPKIRQSAVEQIAPLVRALAADGRGRRPQVMDLLEVAKRLLGDDADEVRAAAEQSFISIVDHCAHDEASEWLLQAVVGSLLALARSRSRNDTVLRGPAVGVLLRLASSLPSTLFEALVVPQLFQLASDPLVAVRKALATGLPDCCRALPPDSDCLSDGLLPLFSSLCLDSAADVREECSRALVTVAQAAVASPAPGNMGLVVRAVEGLAADPSASVRECALRSLGPLLVESKVPPKELLDLFLNMVDTSASSHSSCSSSSSSSSPHSLPSPQLEHIFAYNFPAVVLVLGRQRWGELDAAFARLLHSFSVPARRCVACSLHELARMLCKPVRQGGVADVAAWDSSRVEEHRSKGESGEEEMGAVREGGGDTAKEGASAERAGLETSDVETAGARTAAGVETAASGAVVVDPLPRLMEAFDLIMCDVDEVRMGLMEHFAEFVACLPPAEAQHCILALPRALWRLGAIHTLPPSTAPGPDAIPGMGPIAEGGAETLRTPGRSPATGAPPVASPVIGGGGGGGWGMARGRDRPPPPMLWPDLKEGGESAPVVVPFSAAGGTPASPLGEPEAPLSAQPYEEGPGAAHDATGPRLDAPSEPEGASVEESTGTGTGTGPSAAAQTGEGDGVSLLEAQNGAATAQGPGTEAAGTGRGIEAVEEGGEREGLSQGQGDGGQAEGGVEEDGEGELEEEEQGEIRGEGEGGSGEGGPLREGEAPDGAVQASMDEAPGEEHLPPGEEEGRRTEDGQDGDKEGAGGAQGDGPFGSQLEGGVPEQAEVLEAQTAPLETAPVQRVSAEAVPRPEIVEEHREGAAGAPEPETPEPQPAFGQEATLRDGPQGSETGERPTLIVEPLNPPDLEHTSQITRAEAQEASEGSASGTAEAGEGSASGTPKAGEGLASGTPEAGEGVANLGADEGVSGPPGGAASGRTTELMGEPDSELTHVARPAGEGTGEGRADSATVPAEMHTTVVLSGTEETQRGREGDGGGQGASAVLAAAGSEEVEPVDSEGQVDQSVNQAIDQGISSSSPGYKSGADSGAEGERELTASAPEPESEAGGTPQVHQEDPGAGAGGTLAGQGWEPSTSDAFEKPRVTISEPAVTEVATIEAPGSGEGAREGASEGNLTEGSSVLARDAPGDASGEGETDQAGAGEGAAGEAARAGGMGGSGGEVAPGEEASPASSHDSAGTAPSAGVGPGGPSQPNAETPPPSPSPSAPPQQQLVENPRPSRRQREQLRVQGPQSDWHLRQMVAQQARILAEVQPSPEVHRVLVDILASLCSDRIAAVREEAAVQLGWMLHHCCCQTREGPPLKLAQGPGKLLAATRSGESTQTQAQHSKPVTSSISNSPSSIEPQARADGAGIGEGSALGTPAAGEGGGSSGEGTSAEGHGELTTEGAQERSADGTPPAVGGEQHSEEGGGPQRVGAARRAAVELEEGLAQAEGIPIDRLSGDSERLLNLAAKFAHSTSYRDRQIFVLMFRGLREASCKATLAQHGRQGSINSQGSSVTALCEEEDGEPGEHREAGGEWGGEEEVGGDRREAPGEVGGRGSGESEGVPGGDTEGESESESVSDIGRERESNREIPGGAEVQQEPGTGEGAGPTSSVPQTEEPPAPHSDTSRQEAPSPGDAGGEEGVEGEALKEDAGVEGALKEDAGVEGALKEDAGVEGALKEDAGVEGAKGSEKEGQGPADEMTVDARVAETAAAAEGGEGTPPREEGEDTSGRVGEGPPSSTASDPEPSDVSGLSEGEDAVSGSPEVPGGSLQALGGQAEGEAGGEAGPEAERKQGGEGEPLSSPMGVEQVGPPATDGSSDPVPGALEDASEEHSAAEEAQQTQGRVPAAGSPPKSRGLTSGAPEDCAKELLLGLMLPRLHQLSDDKVGNVSIPAKQEIVEVGRMGFNFLIAF